MFKSAIDVVFLKRQRHDTQVCVREANDACYAATVDDKVAVRIGAGDWDPSKAGMDAGQGAAWALAVAGPGFAVWEARHR